MEAAHPEWITLESPTQRVGNELKDGFKKVAHSSRMLSLNDVFDREEVQAWVTRSRQAALGARHEFFVDEMDGLACNSIYQDGNLVRLRVEIVT